MEKIQLHSVLPQVFAQRNDLDSEIWKQDVTLSAATLCLDKIKMPFLEGDILLPYLRIQVITLGEDLWENGMKLNLFHVILFNV